MWQKKLGKTITVAWEPLITEKYKITYLLHFVLSLITEKETTCENSVTDTCSIVIKIQKNSETFKVTPQRHLLHFKVTGELLFPGGTRNGSRPKP